MNPIKFIISTSLFLIISCDAIRPFFISDQEEVNLGNKFKKEILADTKNYPRFQGDLRVVDFVDSLGQVIADAQKDRPKLNFTFTILEDTSINAFAVPGGHVFVYTGLLKNMDNTAELAGVLAHEIGHITKYHGANKLMQGQAIDLVNQILFGEDSSSILAAVTKIVESMTFLQLSQKDEFQADSCAIAYTALAGINPVGMKRFLQKLRQKYGDTPKIFEPFSTHPSMSDRISKVTKLMNTIPGVPSDSTSLLYESQYVAIKNLLD